ncbi:TIGR03862 family flavoprotein [Dyella psychrodurans]|uniref:TIGR03862 family flavoprotein n=1 Tax=Dyella psychrodurans TaxID=1927960 RepID=A0A370XBU8_9GAMM|nr:TIGR03862 family flavoprotein [Dyella psychrodurans]RDS85772.1 TIGR03862 family flavoprotein [Dyella psychrodurans]
MSSAHSNPPGLVIIGGGPAGLMAAETARTRGIEVDLYESKGSVGRKFLIAGKGGMNLTHGEPKADFVLRYGKRAHEVGAWLDDFDADALRAWARDLGIETFVGTSGRVFPSDLKAAPLLRGWVHRLRESGVHFHVHHRWLGWDEHGALRFATPEGERSVSASTVVLALGGGSWPQLGSDGAWAPWLADRGVDIAPLQPSNCGFDIGWSEHLATHHAGAPLKPVAAYWRDAHGQEHLRQGECVITSTGIEGSLVYALSASLRDAIAQHGHATLELDLAPDRTLERLQHELSKPRGSRSFSEHLRRQAGLAGVKAALLYEALHKPQLLDGSVVAQAIKRLPLHLKQARPMAEAISTAGGVRLEALNDRMMLHGLPGVFCAGEMLDWEAPTGGYLLTACFASGRRAGLGAAAWFKNLSPQ